MARDPINTAHDILAMSAEELRMLFLVLRQEIDYPDSDREAQFFYLGQQLRDADFGGLELMLAALRAGARSAAKRKGGQE